MREQKGYIFHRYGSWFVRFMDNVIQPDGTFKRKLVCKKLSVPYGGNYRTKASVKEFAQEKLKPVNGGMLDARSTMLVTDFVEQVYLPQYVQKEKRASTQRGYRNTWENYLKNRLGKLTLRDFRTVHRSEEHTSELQSPQNL